MDCVFSYFNILNDYCTGAEYQIDCGYVRCYLKKCGFKTIQYVNHLSGQYHDYVKDLVNLPCNHYVFYICEYNYYLTRLIVNKVKDSKPLSVIYIMGPDVEVIADNYYTEIDFDIALLQHEHVALEKMLTNKEKKGKIENIVYRLEGRVERTETKEYTYTLDDLGLPYSDGIIPPEEAPNVGLITSLGCFGRCLFCSYNPKRRFLVYKISNVIKELDYISQYISGKDCNIRFFDDCFSVSSKRTKELLEAMAERKYNFKFWCCIRADVITDEIIELMGSLNFKKIVIGLETASKNVLKNLGKLPFGMEPEKFLNLLKKRYILARKQGIIPIFSINLGLPDEKLEDVNRTIQFVKNLEAELSVSVCFMTCFPGSAVFEHSDQYGVVKKSSPVRLPFRTYYPSYNMREVYDLLIHQNILRKNIEAAKANRDSMFIESITGIYYEENLNTAVDFIYIDEEESLALDFIDKNINKNGMVVHRIAELSITNNYYCDNRKILKFDMPAFDSYMKNAYKHSCYVPNQEFIKEMRGKLYWQHNNEYLKGIGQIQVLEEGYIHEMKIPVERTAGQYQFHEFNIQELESMNIKNLCRFSGNCSLCHIRQVEVKGKDIYTCCSGNKIGEIQNDYCQLMQNVRDIRKKTLEDRVCNNCDFSEWCSKCLFPSEREQYCNFQHSNKSLIQYLHIVGTLKKLLHFNRNIFGDKIAVYWRDIERTKTGKIKELKPNICLIENQGRFFILYLNKWGFVPCKENENDCLLHILNGHEEFDVPDTFLMNNLLE